MINEKIKHARSKMISNYGGVGSLIETQDYSVIIETFDNWQYSDLGSNLAEYIIKDDRLLSRLKSRFPNLRHIVSIPTAKASNSDQVKPTSNYFSKWFYCPKCKRFADYRDMKARWIAAGKNTDFFNPPKCAVKACDEAVLEQMRFVMTCKDGHIHDIPWKYWNTYLPEDKTNSENDNEEESGLKLAGPQLDFSKLCCNSQDLRYKISIENTDLTGIRVFCESCKKFRTLKGIFNYQMNCPGKKYWLGMANGSWIEEDCKQQTKVVVKSSNSVYYSNSLTSLYIPERQNPITNDVRIEIDKMLESGKFSRDQVVEIISVQKDISIDILNSYLATGNTTYISDNVFRQGEYDYFLKAENVESNQLKFQSFNCADQILGLDKLVNLKN